MSLTRCSRKAEVRQLLANGHWPDAAEAELRAHVDGCAECREWARVEMLLRGARAQAVRAKVQQNASLIWWRAQLRRRQEAMAKVERPLRWAQAVALLLGVCAVAWVLYGASGAWMMPDASESVRAAVGASAVWVLGAAVALVVAVSAVAAYQRLFRGRG